MEKPSFWKVNVGESNDHKEEARAVDEEGDSFVRESENARGCEGGHSHQRSCWNAGLCPYSYAAWGYALTPAALP